MTEPTLLLKARRPALLSGFDNQVDVLVRICRRITDEI